GTLAFAVGRAFGYTGGAALPMQLINAVAGALGVALFYRLTWRATGRADIALVAALLLGGAYAYWYYAVEIEVYTVATLFLLLCLKLLLDLNQGWSARRFALLGLAQGGAILFHQTNVLFCVPVLVFWMAATSKRQTRKAPVAALLAYPAMLAAAVGLPYLFVGVVVSGFRSWSAFERWLTEYARTGWWGGPITAQKWGDLGAGWADTLAQPGGALLGLLLLGLVVAHARTLARAVAPLMWMLLAWLVVYGAFFLWWEPDNVEFWIASLPPALLLLALALRDTRPWGPEVWMALAIGMTSAAVNYDSIARRGDATTDLQRTIARTLASQSQAADLLLVPDGLLELYLPYYERHDNFSSLNQALFDSGGDWQAACSALHRRIDAALHAGAAAIV
ncbi:MAG TPA: glycosyltransferase family 39 protein, partial [Roseiflexaceae bacterium]|nr:glycosyltransferase family 39 protein [Roseiflexaceae bacterium]